MLLRQPLWYPVLFSSCMVVSLAYADAPVVDAAQPMQLAQNTQSPMPQQAAPQGSQQPVQQQQGQQQASSQSAQQQQNGQTPADLGLAQPELPAGQVGGYTQSLTTEQRTARLEQQVQYLVQLNLPQRLTQLQQDMAKLNGQLAVQKHDIDTLNAQQREFYNDLNRRLNQMNNLSGGNAASGSTTPNPPASSARVPAAAGPLTKKLPASLKAPDNDSADAGHYRSAFTFIQKRQFKKAQQALTDYLDQFPRGQYQVNAHYWLGEIYLLQNNNKAAQNEFNTILTRFPRSSKVADAMLKLGMLDQQNGKLDNAATRFKQIQAAYPDSTAAQLARLHLQQIAKKTT